MEDKLNKYIAKNRERIDKEIAQLSPFSRGDIQKLIEGHAVFVNGKEVRKNKFKVNPGDEILITKIIQKEIKAIPQEMKINVVYEDDDLIVIDKPSGLVVHPAPGHLDGTLVNGLLFHFKDLSNINGNVRPGIVHRIDKDTSGLLVVAKNNEAHRGLAKLLETHEIKRTYYALVDGIIENKITHIKLPIGRNPKHRQQMAITKLNAKDAITHVYLEEVFHKTCLVRCELETGRTHQIRVHLKYIKHPIIGDPLYGKRIDDFGQRLHAAKLEFVHPISGKDMVFESKLPKEFDLGK